MKSIFLIALFLVSACDVPSGQRRQIFQTPVNQPGTVGTNGGTKSGEDPVTEPAPIPGTGTGTSGSATSGTGFAACNLSPRATSLAFGAIGVCQSSVDETQVKFQTTNADSFSRTCIIPTYRDSAGNSTYIGQPQCTYTEAGKIYLGKLYKNRAGFEMYPINGVMIMKEGTMPTYFDCMHAVVWYTQNRNCTYEADYRACMQQYQMYVPNAHQTCCRRQATNYQAAVCNTFKSNFQGQYLDISVR